MAHKWYDQSQPQTLQTAVFLLYFTAVSQLIVGILLGGAGLFGLLLIGGLVGGAYGIANESKGGYRVAVVFSSIGTLFAVFLLYLTLSDHDLSASIVFNAIFYGAMTILLFHPQHREYRRIWFR